MSNYKKLKAQIAALERQAEAARSKEKAEAVAKIKALMSDFDISMRDLGSMVKSTAKAKRTRAPSTPKYQDPKSGATWSGLGKPPKWIALAIKRGRKDDFLIGAPAPTSTATKSKAPEKPKVTAKSKPAIAAPKRAVKKVAVPAKKAAPAAKKSVVKIATKVPAKKPAKVVKVALPKPVKKVAVKIKAKPKLASVATVGKTLAPAATAPQ